VTPDETPAEDTPDADQTVADEDPDTEVKTVDAEPDRLTRFALRARQRNVLVGVLAVLAVASLALLGSLFYFARLPDREMDSDAANVAISAARDGAVAVLSYSPDTLDHDFSSAKSHLTGDFLSYYDQFTQQIVAPAAKQKAVKTTAVVLRAAVADLHPNSAVVLLFVNQSTQSKDRPEPTFTSSSVTVTLAKANGRWLISSFTPV
jgi:Mce-associated membrane protein